MTATATGAAAAALARAKARLAAGTLTAGELDELWREAQRAAAEGPASAGVGETARQALMYIYAAHPHIRSEVLSGAIHLPSPDAPAPQIDPLAAEFPYATVFAAILDGWRVVHFPDHRAPFDDREIDMVGYEFILDKLIAAGPAG